MTERKLTDDEIDLLFSFCAKHYVPEYDLQIELVDHLASGIEEQWLENPDIPFPIALNKTFDKFGIYGFSKIKSQKERELRRKYRHLFWQYTLEFYKLPKVILTLALTLVLFSVYRFVGSFFWVTIAIFASIFAVDLLYFIWIYPRKYKIATKNDKPFLLLGYLKSRQIGLNIIFQFPLQSSQLLSHFNYSYLNNMVLMFAASLLLVTSGIFMYVYFVILPVKIKAHFVQQFPQFVVT